MQVFGLDCDNLEIQRQWLIEKIELGEKTFPFDNKLNFFKSALCYIKGDFENAIKHIEIAVRYWSGKREFALFHGKILYSLGRYYDSAVETLRAITMSLNTQLVEDRLCIEALEFLGLPLSQVNNDQKAEFERQAQIFFGGYYFPLRSAIFEEGNINDFGEYLETGESEYNSFMALYKRNAMFLNDFLTAVILKEFNHENINKILKNKVSSFGINPMESYKAKHTKEFDFFGKDEKAIIPISTTKLDQIVNFTNSENTYSRIEPIAPHTFDLFLIDEPVKIHSEQEFVVGKPIYIKSRKDKPKLVLNVFVDSVSGDYLARTNYENVPYTREFFSKGAIFENCYGTAEWTIPSFSSLVSGLNTKNHGIYYHWPHNREIPKDKKVISEIFNDSDYLTAAMGHSIEFTPFRGGFRGYDRCIHSSCLSLYDSDIINCSINHIETFKGCNNFVFISLFEPHRTVNNNYHLQGLVDESTFQTAMDYKHRLYSKKRDALFEIGFEKANTIRLKEFDKKMKRIYDYIIENFKEDEFVISLFSDHGPGNAKMNVPIKSKSRMNTMMMMRGRGVPIGIFDEFINHFDMIPAITKHAGIDYSFEGYDCVLPRVFGGKGREYTYSETIYQNKPYEALINNEEHIYNFSSLKVTTYDGEIDISEFDDKLICRNTQKQIFDPEFLKYYRNLVNLHTKENRIYSF